MTGTDYTSVDLVKQAERSDPAITAGADALATYVTRASRFLDRYCTHQPDAVDYFIKADVSGEILTHAQLHKGELWIWPHKAVINSFASFAYRTDVTMPFVLVPSQYCVIDGRKVRVMGGQVDMWRHQFVQVQISYNGGLGTTLDDLPDDFVECATIMAIRMFKEAAGGLGDAIGVEALGTVVYTKAIPVRVAQSIQPFVRVVPW